MPRHLLRDQEHQGGHAPSEEHRHHEAEGEMREQPPLLERQEGRRQQVPKDDGRRTAGSHRRVGQGDDRHAVAAPLGRGARLVGTRPSATWPSAQGEGREGDIGEPRTGVPRQVGRAGEGSLVVYRSTPGPGGNHDCGALSADGEPKSNRPDEEECAARALSV
jgi:hypothetical protein